MGLFDIRIETPQIIKDIQRGATQLENNVRREAAQAGNNVNANLSQAGNNVNANLTRVGKNFERTGKRIGKDLGEMSRGNFNNLGSTSLRVLTGFMDEGDQRNLTGETGSERSQREAQAASDLEIANTNAAIEAKRLSGLAQTFEQMAVGRARTPGRRGTMLTGATTSGTLLTQGRGY